MWLYRANQNFGNLHWWWICAIELIKVVPKYFYCKTFEYADITLKTQNSIFIENHCVWGYNFCMTVTHKEIACAKTSFLIPALSIFPTLETKMLSLVGKILWHFDIILHIWLINLLFHECSNIPQWEKSRNYQHIL